MIAKRTTCPLISLYYMACKKFEIIASSFYRNKILLRMCECRKECTTNILIKLKRMNDTLC